MKTRDRIGCLVAMLDDVRDELRAVRRELPRDLRRPCHVMEIEVDAVSRRLRNMRAFLARGGD